MKIHQISLPTPFPVGNVNVYLVREDPVTLIDVGPKTAAATALLRTGLRNFNLSFSDVRRIALTHAHEDHCGLAKMIRDESKDCEIFVHGWETGHLFGRPRVEDAVLLERAGVPGEIRRTMQDFYKAFLPLTDALKDNEYKFLQDETELEFASGALKVLHTPGHTPGSCSFLREANRTVFAGDCVLKRITPNPILALDPVDSSKRFKSLGEYLVSLARIRAVAPTLIYGGHGEPITDYEELFNRYVRSINERQAKVISLVDEKGVTAWQIAAKLFPAAIDEAVHRFLAVSEAVAHLDYAESEGKITVERQDEIEFYKKL